MSPWPNTIRRICARKSKRALREKAEQGIYPGHAPFGYKNNIAIRSIEVDPQRAPVLKKIFEMYASGQHSLTTLRQAALSETGARISRAYLEMMLKNPFYIGRFIWQGIEYKGTHEPLVSPELFQRPQDTFAGRNKPKYRKHKFAFAGLLTCAHDGCTVTTELQHILVSHLGRTDGRRREEQAPESQGTGPC